ncbi:MAG: WYL domain-containing protein [Bacteroidales bacterium]|nr:WYL domain-containing protein [Bacteroidales bacterium]
MAHNDFKRYIWLIELLNRVDGASFADINDAWQDDPLLNPLGEPLPVRTFYNHIKAIKEIFDLEITQSKRDRKYRVSNYYGRVQEEIVSYLSLNATINRYKDLRGRVLGEEEPLVDQHCLQLLCQAMHEGKQVRLGYRKYGERCSRARTLSPYCLKIFKRRWYLLAKEGDSLKTFALDDRTTGIEMLDKNSDYAEGFDAEAFFRDTFGILKSPARNVIIKAYGHEADYWRSSPVHPSQQEIETENDYAVFSLKVGTDAWDFVQELLSRGDRIEVLKPQSLRKEMALCIEKMRRRYRSTELEA